MKRSVVKKTTHPAAAVSHPSEKKESAVVRAPARTGKRQIAGWYPPEVRKQLRQMALDHETSTQELLRQALNLLFAEYQKPEIA